MLNNLSASQQVYLVTGYTDLRRSIDGLAMIVQSQLNLDPFSTALFLFCGRRRDRIKGLLWEGDGFLLALQAAGQRAIPMAAQRNGGKIAHDAADQMASGRSDDRTAESNPRG